MQPQLQQKICLRMKIKDNWMAALAVTLLAVVSMLLAMQGWGGTLVGFDLVPHAMDAERFLAKGVIPSHGCLSSLGSYIPPGTTWLMIPGQLLFSDPRLVVVPGAFILHVLTLAGVYVLGRWSWNSRVGLYAACVFAFSPIALGTAASLWPRYPMAATVWGCYFLCRWAYDKRAGSLGLAILVILLGLYVHLEGLLLFGVIPLLWFVFRPPVRLKVVAIALAIGFLVWWPYLLFEGSRNFLDLKSQLGQVSLLYTKSTLAQVNHLAQQHGLPLIEEAKPSVFAPGKMPLKARVLEYSDFIVQKLWSAAQSVGSNLKSYGCGEWVASVLSIIMLTFLFMRGLPHVREVLHPLAKQVIRESMKSIYPYRRVVTVVGAVALLMAFVANEWVLGRLMSSDGSMESYTILAIRLFQVVLAFTGTALLFRRPVKRWVGIGVRWQASHLSVIALVLGVPWLIMAMMVAPDVPYRFWNYWPVQVVALAGILTMAVGKWARHRKLLQGMILAGVALVMMCNSAVIQHISAWHREGYRGDSDEVKATQHLAEMIRADGVQDLSIGYGIPFSPYMAYYRVFDDVYKVGLPYDWHLKTAYGITNASDSPSGLSDRDRYRLVSSRPVSGHHLRVDMVNGAGWKMIGQYGEYSCWRKTVE